MLWSFLACLVVDQSAIQSGLLQPMGVGGVIGVTEPHPPMQYDNRCKAALVAVACSSAQEAGDHPEGSSFDSPSFLLGRC